MEVRLAATTPTAGDDAVVRILIAIELSKKSWIVGANTPLKAKTSQFKLAAGDWKALLELIERLRRQVARKLGRPVHEIEAISCYEAGYDGFWLHHLLANRMPAVGCAFRASRKRTLSDCIASASGSSVSASSMSTASKACAHSTASMITNPCGPTARRSLEVCELVTGAPCRLG